MLELRILCRLPTEEIRMAEPIHQEVTIDAVPADVYAALTEATRFAEVTAAPASMEASPGGAFSLFNGMIEGRNIELASGRRIVQAWRVKNWPAGRFSLVSFGLHVHRVALLQSFERGTTTASRVDSTIAGINAVSGFAGLFFVAAGIVWLIWQHRAHSNLRALGAPPLGRA